MVTTITSKGQVTIPKPVREKLNLQPGDLVDFVIEDDGGIRLMPVADSILKLKAMVPPPDAPLSLEEMQAAIEGE